MKNILGVFCAFSVYDLFLFGLQVVKNERMANNRCRDFREF